MKNLFLLIGIALSFAAIFANLLGIDNDAGWGGGRILLLKTGIALLTLGILLHFFQGPIQRLRTRAAECANAFGRERALRFVFAAMTLLTAAAYIWFLRIEERDVSRAYNFYGELARGFKRGNLYLPETPSPALLALSNPYDYALRKQAGVEDFPWDASLYNGRFYFYWGPSPALFLLPFNDDTLSRIEDYHLALVFAFGLFVYSALIVARFWLRLKHAPVWIFAFILAVLGFSVPVTPMLRHADIYEAAIFACQFFFMGGCYWAFISFLEERPTAWAFALAGVHWAFAIGSRVTILPAVFIAVLALAFPTLSSFYSDWKNRAARMTQTGWQRLRLLLAVGLPLLAGGVALAWYNDARFGSIVEFGVRYQLANVDYTQFEGSFGLKYASENLRVYLLQPVDFLRRFPFISLVEYTPSNDRLSGLLLIAPFFVLAFLPLFRLVSGRKNAALINPALFLFAGAAVVSAFIILIFYFVALRYTLDFLPATLILIALSLGLEYEALSDKKFAAGALSFITGILAFVNVTAGALLATPESGTLFILDLLNSVSKMLGLK